MRDTNQSNQSMKSSEKFSSCKQVIIGRNSHIWSVISKSKQINTLGFQAISHNEVEDFTFSPLDTVWVLSYSRIPTENEYILKYLRDSGVSKVVYITSASTNIADITNCYEYPQVKCLAHQAARKICDAEILSIGLFYSEKNELPSGKTMATSANELITFMLNPCWSTRAELTALFQPIERPFRSSLEKGLFTLYGKLQKICGPYPCLLRPVDVILRAFNMRWYGYLYLSNQLWFTTI